MEVEPGEVAILYNNTGLGFLGESSRVVKEQGMLSFLPLFQRVEKLDTHPQILVMEGSKDLPERGQVPRLTVRASDGSNFYFEKVEIHYQVIPGMAADVIALSGVRDAYKLKAVRVHAREVLRNEFGKYTFLQVANPSTYGGATSHAKTALNERLNPLGIEITNIPPPKPKFDNRVEQAIEDRQSSEQEVQVQVERRNKLHQEKGRRTQQLEQTKSAEYQQLLGELEARKQQAANRFIAVKREADKYFIERQASARAMREEKVTRAKANEVAYRKEAEALVAKIKAVGDQGEDILNKEIAEHIFPQMSSLKAQPYSNPSSPLDIRHIQAEQGELQP